MCGRYASYLPPEAIRATFRTRNALVNIAPNWNVAPTQPAMVVRRHPESGERHLDLLRWGLVPHFTKDLKAARKPINARSETAASSGMFRGALASSEGDNRGTSARGLELGGRSTGENTSTHEISRHLIKASELMEARADELFVIRKSGPPLRCGQAPYFRRPELVSLVKDNRFHRAAAE